MTDGSCRLSGNALKIIAALTMVIDHVGLLFFPKVAIFRIIGRLAFPIFAFMISEGARYTSAKLRYFSTMFGLAFICQAVFFFFNDGSLNMCVLVTFSVAIALIYVMQFVKAGILSPKTSWFIRPFYVAVGLLALWAVKIINSLLEIDYGLWGCILPAFASLLDFRGMEIPKWLKKLNLDNIYARSLSFGVGVAILAHASGIIQYFSLFAIPLLLLYSGKRGRLKMKYFFYFFYPLHLVFLEAIFLLTRLL